MANAEGVEFVGIFINDTELNAREFVAQYRFIFPTGFDGRRSSRQDIKSWVHQLDFSSASMDTFEGGQRSYKGK
jgi:hypothetical protein